MSRLWRLLGIAFISVAAIAGTAAPAIAGTRASSNVYRPAFKHVPGSELLSGSNYLAIAGAKAGEVQLINTSTGRTLRSDHPGCVPDAVGGQWLAMTCGSGAAQHDALYDIQQNRTFPFTPSTTCATGACPGIAAIGTRWIALTSPCSESSKCPASFEFKNLSTGATRRDPTNARTRIDLNSVDLGKAVCRPLRVPRANERIEDGTYLGWGSLTLDGSYGIEAGGSGVFLQHCGSRAKTLLTRGVDPSGCAARACPPAHNRDVIIWQSAAGRLNGISLRNLRRFEIVVPRTVDPSARHLKYVRADQYTIALAGRTVYLQTPGGKVWTARVPRSLSDTR
jgi:hypothetical protein